MSLICKDMTLLKKPDIYIVIFVLKVLNFRTILTLSVSSRRCAWERARGICGKKQY